MSRELKRVKLRSNERKRTWHTTMLVNNDEIGDLVGSASLSKLLDDVVSSIYSVRVGEDESHFLKWTKAQRGRETG